MWAVPGAKPDHEAAAIAAGLHRVVYLGAAVAAELAAGVTAANGQAGQGLLKDGRRVPFGAMGVEGADQRRLDRRATRH